MASNQHVYHIILIKTKPSTTSRQIEEWATVAKSNVGKIPGLLSSRIGTPQAPLSTARTKGYEVGVVMIFESAQALADFGKNPIHELSAKLSREFAEDRLAFDFFDMPLLF
ncbi:unnamed protein product [Clonostachys rosea f. rosea IK726]|uniref:Stress-response A/B barrel domain-containing protein n=2 Tax=Bionectria ochroleuca TaxID=29856 RepID=A0A0B7KR06_BIOOC|nr:unnamed protein product [Clonostachys rosea f. rosea IK726]